MQAKVALPAAYHGTPGRLGNARTALVAEKVENVRTAVLAPAPVMLTGLVVPKLKVGRCWAPAGLAVMLAVSEMLPVKPPPGVIVIVEVFPVVAPDVTVTAVSLSVKLGIGAGVTVTAADDPDALK
jgi:hypothetical protein